MKLGFLSGINRIFYGYWIVLVSFISLMVMAGCSFYGFGLFVKPLEMEFAWSRAQIMGASTCYTLVMGGSGILVGRFLRDFGAKRIIIIGSIIISICLSLVSRINSLWQFYLLYGLSAIGFSAIGFVPITYLVFNWFHKKQGRIIGLVTTGIGAGGIIMPLLIGGVLIPSLGWRNAFLILGSIPLVILIPLTVFVVKEKPEDMGLLPDNERIESVSPGNKQTLNIDHSLTLKQAVKTSAFWFLGFGGLLSGFATMAIMQNQVAYVTDLDFSMATAATAVSIVGVFSAGGKLVFGMLCDWINPKYSRGIGLIFLLVSVGALLLMDGSGVAIPVWVYAVFLGLSFGSWVPSISMLIRVNFGMVAYGVIFGVANAIDTLGGSIGPLVTGYIYDITQSYRIAFVLFLFLIVIAVVSTLLIRKPKGNS